MELTFEANRSFQESETRYFNNLRSDYLRYKQLFEEATTLSPQEQLFVHNNDLEDRLNAIKFDFWKLVNSIVTSYFGIMKLLKTKREVEDDIHRIWCSKLTNIGDVMPVIPAGPSQDSQEKYTSDIEGFVLGIGATEVEQKWGPSQMEDSMMRFKVGLIFSEDLVKTVQRSVFSLKDTKVLPGYSTFKMLEKEVKWTRNQKLLLAREIERLKIRKEILKRKLNLPRCDSSSGQLSKWSNPIRTFFKHFWKIRRFEENLILQ